MDGKLVDGNDAPSDPMRAKIAQKKILIKYDKNALIMKALVSNGDIIRKADGDLDKLIKLANDDKLISK